MFDDLRLLLITVAVAAPIGVGLGLFLSFRCPGFCKQYAAWSKSLPWWMWLAWAVFFLAMAAAQVGLGWWSFAAFFGAFAALELVAMGMAIRRGVTPPDLPTGGAPQRTTPEV